jgi:hypothetical protein
METMSAKATGLVWDLECPKKYGDLTFKPSHKYTLVAYADHANHEGGNIWPAVKTIARKTGLDERTIQRLTSDLEAIGLLVEDGQGPRGTNKWYLPYDERGDKLTPLSKRQGDENEDSSGDIPSGDIPSGDKLTPELKEPEQEINIGIKEQIMNIFQAVAYSIFKQPINWEHFKQRLEQGDVTITGENLRPVPDISNPMQITISGLSRKMHNQFTEAEVFEDRYYKSFANIGLEITFTE